ncbi:MAG: dihydrodipicolinate synthase family protein [Alphaproteobacteria bacterium]
MISAQDMHGMYAIIATPARENVDRLDATDTIDFAESERLINNLIRDGATGLIVLGTTGECATLSTPDYESFVDCVLDTVSRRVPTFVGATAMGGHEVARRLRFIQDRGATGSLLGLPMWQPLTTKAAIDYYAAVSDVFPELAIMAYANARAFRYGFPLEFWSEVAKAAPTVTSAKYSRAAGLGELIAATKGRIHFMPNEMVVHEFYKISPKTTTACWATASGMNPLPAVALMRAIAANNAQAIDTLAAAIAWANEPIMPMVENPELFAQYNIQVEKTRINAAGYSKCGPIRPPYQDFPEEHAGPARECGKRWASICAAYKADFEFAEGPWTRR